MPPFGSVGRFIFFVEFLAGKGIPVNRPRCYSAITLNQSLQKNPYCFGYDLLEKIAFCNLSLTGSVFLQATQQEVDEYVAGLANRRKLPPRVDGKPYRCLAVMDCGDRKRMEQYLEVLRSKNSPYVNADMLDVNIDLAQAPPFGSAAAVIPTIIKNSKMYNVKAQRFFLPGELLSAHGVHPCVADHVPQTLLELCSKHPAKAHKMIGNSMCVPQVGAVFASIILNLMT